LSDVKKCFSRCEFFKCEQRAIQYRGNEVYCRFADDICNGASCKYAICVRNRLLTNGICGITLKRVTTLVDIPPEEAVKGVRIKGKLQKRLGEKEIF